MSSGAPAAGSAVAAADSHAAVTKHADTTSHQTRKSWKTNRRDKPRHSGKLHGGVKKGGAGGKTTWGKPGDEVKGFETAPGDPNYSPDGDDAEAAYDTAWTPSAASATKFASSLDDLASFKRGVKAAAEEFVSSSDYAEFDRALREVDMPVYHQELPYVLIRYSLDLSDDQRGRISSLLNHLNKSGVITRTHMGAGVRKLYNNLSDITIDHPKARTLIREHVQYAIAAGFLDASLASQLESEYESLSDAAKVSGLKQRIRSALEDYFNSEDVDDCVKALQEINAPYLNFEVVKQLLLMALDRGNRQCEAASYFFSAASGRFLTQSDLERGFTIVLERVDDLQLDVPQLLKYLSIFVARAVVDEVLPPAFLVRVDLNSNDAGSRVLQQAGELIKQEHATDRLQYAWEDLEYEEEEQKGSANQQ